MTNSPHSQLAAEENPWEKIRLTVGRVWESMTLSLRYPLPEGWLIFQGESTQLWWSVPDDDRCPGALFDTQEDAYRFASEHRAGGQR